MPKLSRFVNDLLKKISLDVIKFVVTATAIYNNKSICALTAIALRTILVLRLRSVIQSHYEG